VCVCVKTGCSMESVVVCGMNGETYDSECLAWSVGGVLVDYLGPCRLLIVHSGTLRTYSVSTALNSSGVLMILNYFFLSFLPFPPSPISSLTLFFLYLSSFPQFSLSFPSFQAFPSHLCPVFILFASYLLFFL